MWSGEVDWVCETDTMPRAIKVVVGKSLRRCVSERGETSGGGEGGDLKGDAQWWWGGSVLGGRGHGKTWIHSHVGHGLRGVVVG